jgi:hypothetical protein
MLQKSMLTLPFLNIIYKHVAVTLKIRHAARCCRHQHYNSTKNAPYVKHNLFPVFFYTFCSENQIL